jgi:pimeloyl-ACP methyl ester carboxylesterase
MARLGRVIAPDLIGHGDSDKLPASEGPGRYTLEGSYDRDIVKCCVRRFDQAAIF